ncbi:hypothetical protein PPYR_03680 [Photinus pyralis]|uniref:TGF-beta propeptide domain-containing protein n=1 Tax=Photinus pyralis TaxID=7054 RepID=A0A1Y1L9G7_PHOPY|nr:hypothetical protein PPYR_03680 [Photinus pyralis]
MPLDFVLLLLLALLLRTRAMPVDFDDKVKFENAPEIEKNLVDYLNWYYDTYMVAGANHEVQENGVENEDIYEKMQSDQAPPADFGQLNKPMYVNLSSIVNLTSENQSDEYHRIMRNRTKDAWIQILKNNILRHVGRTNSSTSKPPNGFDVPGLNMSKIIPDLLPLPDDSVDDVTEKIRSYYPSCELPKNTDQDLWKDENTMNLYFNVEHPDSSSINVATATLRLYRVPAGNVTSTTTDSCENSTGSEEQLMRISIYWYTKSLKRQRVKRRLSDSKVIAQSAKWVELSVLPATKAWMKGKNLGLAILVEDQEGAVLKADKYFKGASCMVGTSTPKPIPTVIVDAARWANELERINGSPGRNTTTAFFNHLSLLPTVDICTLEFPQNSTHDTAANYKGNVCDLKRVHQKPVNADAPGALPTSRHIRHQKHNMDPRSRMVGQRLVLTSEEMRNLNAHLANSTYPSIQR